MINRFVIFLLTLLISTMAPAKNVLRIAGWGGEIPTEVFRKFEDKHHIKIYFSSFESNESLDVKLRSSTKGVYDLIMPSSYFIPTLQARHLLKQIDVQRIPAYSKIQAFFKPSIYAIPLNWSSTGIFYNKKYLDFTPRHWQDLWNAQFKNQVLLLDDPREVFSMALIALAYSPNDEDLGRIQKAYEKLLLLRPNIKLFASDALANLMIDEDAIIGMAWSADILKAQKENPNIGFVMPEEGYVLNTESFAIPNHTLNEDAAYAFINFMLEPENLALMTVKNHFPPTISHLESILPKTLLENPILFPKKDTLEKGILQTPVSQKTLAQYNELWEMFKLSL